MVECDRILAALRQDAGAPWPGQSSAGRPIYDTFVILKMHRVVFLYNLSERQAEVAENDSLSIKWFLGLAVDEPAPDHSALTKFKNRMVEQGMLEAAEDLLAEIILMAQERKKRFGSVQVMDRGHTAADVNAKRRKYGMSRVRSRRGMVTLNGVREALAGCRTPVVRRSNRREFIFGYKAHCSLNAESELITSVVVTPGNANDGRILPQLLEKDLAKEIPFHYVAADLRYDDGDNHFLLETKELHSAIYLNEY